MSRALNIFLPQTLFCNFTRTLILKKQNANPSLSHVTRHMGMLGSNVLVSYSQYMKVLCGFFLMLNLIMLSVAHSTP